MKKGRFSGEQIIGVLEEHQAGIRRQSCAASTDLGCDLLQLAEPLRRYGGLEVSDARRLKSLEEANRRLKKLLAESMLDVATLKDAVGKF